MGEEFVLGPLRQLAVEATIFLGFVGSLGFWSGVVEHAEHGDLAAGAVLGV